MFGVNGTAKSDQIEHIFKPAYPGLQRCADFPFNGFQYNCTLLNVAASCKRQKRHFDFAKSVILDPSLLFEHEGDREVI